MRSSGHGCAMRGEFGSLEQYKEVYCYLVQINLVRGLRHDPMLAHEPSEFCFGFQVRKSLALPMPRFLYQCFFPPNTDSSTPPFCPYVGIYKGMKVWHCEGHSFQNSHITYNNSHTPSLKTQTNFDFDKIPPNTPISRVTFYNTIKQPWSYIASLPTNPIKEFSTCNLPV